MDDLRELPDIELQDNADVAGSVSHVENIKSNDSALPENREEMLVREKHEMEKDFNLKRARFMELFKQKESELEQEKNLSSFLKLEKDELLACICKFQHELDECKSQVTIAECTKENEVDEERRRCREEIASLQQIVKEAMSETTQAKIKYEREIARLKKINEKLEQDAQDNKTQVSNDSKEGVLSVMTKTLAKRVSSLNAYSQNSDSTSENLEDSMKKAQEDAEVLRSLVVPLEEEIQALKEKLRAADEKIQSLENNYLKSLETNSDANIERLLNIESESELDEKLKGLHKGYQAEKSSRNDLEMYVSVLQTQKTMLQTEVDDLQKQLRDTFQQLDKEKREHTELKQTWHMANDKFLEEQKIQLDDLKRFQSVLTAEQQKAIAELQKKDSGSVPVEGVDSQSSSKRSSPISFPSSPRHRKSPSPLCQIGMNVDKAFVEETKCGDEFVFDVDKKDRSQLESLSLMETVEEQDTKTTIDANLKQMETTGHGDLIKEVPPGKRLVNEREWLLIQDEIKLLKERMGRSCDMCSNYEAQLQKAQEKERELNRAIKSLEKSNEWHKSDFQNESQMKKELEEKLNQSSTEMQSQLADLYSKLEATDKLLSEVRQDYALHVQWAKGSLKELTVDREEIQAELNRLQQENDTLVGKYTVHSQQMQNEAINLPDSTDDMHLLLLRLREDLIVAKVAKEHIEETLRSEILFLKERVLGEQQSRESTEHMFTQEIDTLRQKVAILESIKEQHQVEQLRRSEAERNLRETQQKLTETNAKHKQMITALHKKVEEGVTTKERLEMELSQMRGKVLTLQKDLDNNEVVQRDFVKLSQSLQVQLEKIRESEKEVRWQHEEDVEDCSNCKQPFTVTRRRHHCRHCGKIFCSDCTSKVVLSGPNRKPSKVCDVCHTLLVPDTAPYFSTEPPHTPD